MRKRSKSGRRPPEPRFGNTEWEQFVASAEMLEVEISWDSHGRMQARVTDLESGDVTILTPPTNIFQ